MRIKVGGIVVCLMFTLSLAANPSKVIRHDQGIDGEFVVVLESSTPVSAVEGLAQSLAASYAVTVKQVYPYALRGFLATGLETNFEAMAGDPRIDYIEQNARVSMPPPEVSGTQWTTYGGYRWFLDRLDELVWLPPPGPGPDSTYNMCTEAREAVVYIIDTGIYPHTEFESRILDARDFVGAAKTDNRTPRAGASHTERGSRRFLPGRMSESRSRISSRCGSWTATTPPRPPTSSRRSSGLPGRPTTMVTSLAS